MRPRLPLLSGSPTRRSRGRGVTLWPVSPSLVRPRPLARALGKPEVRPIGLFLGKVKMNNLFLVLLYVLGMVFIPNIAFCDVKPPIGYTLVETSDFDSRIYKNSNGTVFVVVVDTSKSNSHVNFGGRSLSQTRKYYYTVNGKSYLATRITAFSTSNSYYK